MFLQEMFKDSGVSMPSFDDFKAFDVNSDGNLLIDEWLEVTGC